jgi:hypothetical protein
MVGVPGNAIFKRISDSQDNILADSQQPKLPDEPGNPGHAAALNGVWGSDASNVWAAGDQGVIIRWVNLGSQGGQWQGPIELPSNIDSKVDFRGVWGTDSGGDVWTVSDRGNILHWQRP